MAKYRKKPVIVNAEQIPAPFIPRGVFVAHGDMHVITIHGQKTPVAFGDWIIEEPDGKHYYPCKPGIFAETYELVED